MAVSSFQIGRSSPNWESTPTAPASRTSRARLKGAKRSHDQSIRASSDRAVRAGRERGRRRLAVASCRRGGVSGWSDGRGWLAAAQERRTQRVGVGGRERVEGDPVVVDAGADLHLLQAEDPVQQRGLEVDAADTVERRGGGRLVEQAPADLDLGVGEAVVGGEPREGAEEDRRDARRAGRSTGQ